MSKPALFGVMVAWLVTITYIVNSIVEFSPTTDIGVNNPVALFDGDAVTVWDLLGTFWKALTFSIDGLPIIFNLFFWIPTAIIGYMIIAFLRGGD